MNIYRMLRELVPDHPVLLGRVLEHHEDDTSTVFLLSSMGDVGLINQMSIGSTIRARGTTVPVGENAFVRRGVIETRAPDGVPDQEVIGVITKPPAPVVPPVVGPPPLDTHALFDGSGPLTVGYPAEETQNNATWTEVGATASMAGGNLVMSGETDSFGGIDLGYLFMDLAPHRVSPTGWKIALSVPEGDWENELFDGVFDLTVAAMLWEPEGTAQHAVVVATFHLEGGQTYVHTSLNRNFEVMSEATLIGSNGERLVKEGLELRFAPEGFSLWSNDYQSTVQLQNLYDNAVRELVTSDEAKSIAGLIVRRVYVTINVPGSSDQNSETGGGAGTLIHVGVKNIELTEI